MSRLGVPDMTSARMIDRIRLSGSIALVIAVCWLVTGSVGCRDDLPVVDSGARPDQVIDDFIMHESASGERLYTLEADTAYVFEGDGYIDVVRPRVTFYNETGAVHAVLVADEGTLLSRTNDLIARRNLLVRTADSTFLWTDSLGWNNDIRLVRTDAPVEIRTPKGEVSGQGLVADAGLTRIEIQSEVTGRSGYRFDPTQETETETLED